METTARQRSPAHIQYLELIIQTTIIKNNLGYKPTGLHFKTACTNVEHGSNLEDKSIWPAPQVQSGCSMLCNKQLAQTSAQKREEAKQSFLPTKPLKFLIGLIVMAILLKFCTKSILIKSNFIVQYNINDILWEGWWLASLFLSVRGKNEENLFYERQNKGSIFF